MKLTLRVGFISLLLITLFLSTQTKAQENLWRDISPSEVSGKYFQESLPSQYRLLSLNLPALKTTLNSSALDSDPNAFSRGPEIILPLPNSTTLTFKVARTEVLPDAAGYSQIRTFIATCKENPLITARLDYTVFGFHAMIMKPDGWVFIEPYSLGTTHNYICYDRRYSTSHSDFTCEVENRLYHRGDAENVINHAQYRSAGTQLKTYRLALACTGEYAAFYGGTKAGALSGMVTSVNRVTAVYELELAVRLVLIANDSLLVYTNSATDPYTNGSGSTMLGENQTNITTVIGSANYDIGHVFSTGGGGIAGLGVVCSSTNKSRGVTGSSAPIGDAYDIDYVAHEMGHQYGGNHTFNSVTGSCNGNRSSGAAYEPGSGTTIMAYAGICGADDIQPHSDAIFATKSFDEIQTYITSSTGSTCPIVTATGNTAPVVTNPANKSIPYLTPFALTGSATDANGDPLTYLWEEFDTTSTGSAPPSPPAGSNSPIFRVFTPQSSPTRVFPQMSDIVNNTSTIGELLPTYGRQLKFRLTARDNRLNGGGVGYNDTPVQLNVVNTGAAFAVTAPNTAVTWVAGTTQTVTWNVSGTTAAPISCSNVNILLSSDGGFTYPTTLASNVSNSGSATITVPVVLTSQARVKVEAAGNYFFDISNTNFTIIGGSAVLSFITTNALSATQYCAGDNLSVSYAGDGPANAGNIFTAQLSDGAGSFASPISIGTLSSTALSGTIACTIPAGTPQGSGYRIRVISSNPSIVGTDNGSNFSIYVTTLGAAGTITGTSIVCQGNSGVVYSVPAVPNASTYNWTLPTGASIASGSGTNSITVNFSASAVSGNITVSASNPCATGAVSPAFALTVGILPSAAGSITGSAQVCQSSSASFSVGSIANASSYTWTVPSGATITSGAGTTSITVSFGASAVSGNVTVAGNNTCGNGTSSSFYVSVVTIPTSPVISASGSTSFCNGGSVDLSYTAAGSTVYQWRKDGTAISGANSSPLTATLAGTYDVIAYGNEVFSSSAPVAITDNNCATGGVESPIIVSGYTGTVQSGAIRVSINITHTWDADLIIALISPANEVLPLAVNVGSSADNFTNSVFTDAGSAQIPATGAPYTGIYKPWASSVTTCITSTKNTFAALGIAGAINPNGTWKLKVVDNAGSDIGTINSWSITFPASLNGPCYASSNSIPVTITSTPTISTMNPTSGVAGQTVTLSGSGFTGTTSVTFNGSAASFTVVNDNTITATVPAGVTTGFVTVTTPCGSVNSPFQFSASITLNLTVYIEGYVLPSGVMNTPAGSGNCDTLTVQLASPTAPYSILYTSKGVINSSGTGSFSFPGSAMGSSYYIVVRHRNCLETWSGSPVPMPSNSNTFIFSSAVSQAYGSNMVNVGGGHFAIRSGDLNQDGVINNADFLIAQSALSFGTGYLNADVTGDGIVESADYSLIETNSGVGISVIRP